MTGKFLVQNEEEMFKFLTLLKLGYKEKHILEDIAIKQKPIVVNISYKRYDSYIPLKNIINSNYEEIRRWVKNLKEWRHLV